MGDPRTGLFVGAAESGIRSDATRAPHAAGVDLDTDILPAIRAKAQRLKRPAGSWAYFADAIREAHARRIEAGKGVARPPPIEAGEKRWRTRLVMARERRIWPSSEWGPCPGSPGCQVPSSLLEPDDGNGWGEWEQAS